MKTILCYGDSITWGYIPGNAGRYPRETRWPNVMQKDLGSGYEIITEGLRGRYTVHDEPYRPGRNGAALLQPILESHSPVDLLIIFLGTNDVLHYPAVTSADAARGMEILIKIAQASETGPDNTSPEILIISPPLIGTLSAELQQLCHGDPAHSAKFAGFFQLVAEQRGVYYLDGGGSVRQVLLMGSISMKPGIDAWDKLLAKLLSEYSKAKHSKGLHKDTKLFASLRVPCL